MLNIIEAYGIEIRRIAGQVARQYGSRSGAVGYGWPIVEADDIEQAVYEQFLKSGIDANALDAMGSPQGYIRTTARLYGAANEAKARRRAMVTDFSESRRHGARHDFSWVANSEAHASRLGNPEAEVVETDLVAGARRLIETILTRVTSITSREVARLFYLKGLDSVGIAQALRVEGAAVRKALQRAREEIGPEADASLRAWREFAHPGSKRPQGTDTHRTAPLSPKGRRPRDINRGKEAPDPC